MLADAAALFEKLILEVNQAGLSWTTILKQARILPGGEIVNFRPALVDLYEDDLGLQPPAHQRIRDGGGRAGASAAGGTLSSPGHA